MIVVTGISGVGKTHTVRAFISANPEYRHVAASQLLSGIGLPTSGLDVDNAERNQIALNSALARLSAEWGNRLIVDGHAVIETQEGPMVASIGEFSELAISGFVTIIGEPDTIRTRRLEKSRTESEAAVGSLQDLEIKTSADWAANIGVKHAIVGSGDTAAFAKAVSSFRRP